MSTASYARDGRISWVRYRFMVRSGGAVRWRTDRLHARLCLGGAPDGHVGLPPGPEKAKRMMFTGVRITGVEDTEMGQV